MDKSYRSYKPHPNKVNPNITNTKGLQFRVNISDPKTWKGTKGISDISNNTTNSTAPTNSRPPLTPVSGSGPLYRRGRTSAAPNPIRHWRKQLQPEQGKSTGSISVGQVMDRPGGSVVLNKNSPTCDPLLCQSSLTTYVPANYVKPLKQDNCWTAPSNIYQPTIVKKVICDPEQRARQGSRYASTNLSKNYYTTGKAYLRARVKLLEQNQTLSQLQGNTYVSSDNQISAKTQPIAANSYLPPSDSKTTGSQLYNSVNCPTDNGLCPQVIYKPNNYLFAQEGAVSSSSLIARRKYNAIKKNNVNFLQLNPDGTKANLQVNGQELPGSTPMMYRGDTAAPYFIKSKYQLPNLLSGSTYNKAKIGAKMPSGGKGIKRVCLDCSSLQTNQSSNISQLTSNISQQLFV